MVFVCVAEGDGYCSLVRDAGDVAAFGPLDFEINSINVSNAAAIALYELRVS